MPPYRCKHPNSINTVIYTPLTSHRRVEYQTSEQYTPPIEAGGSEYLPSWPRSEDLYIQPSPFGDQSLSPSTPDIFSTPQAPVIYPDRSLQSGFEQGNPPTNSDYSPGSSIKTNPVPVPDQDFSNSEVSGLNHSTTHFQPTSIFGEGEPGYLGAQSTYAS